MRIYSVNNIRNIWLRRLVLALSLPPIIVICLIAAVALGFFRGVAHMHNELLDYYDIVENGFKESWKSE